MRGGYRMRAPTQQQRTGDNTGVLPMDDGFWKTYPTVEVAYFEFHDRISFMSAKLRRSVG